MTPPPAPTPAIRVERRQVLCFRLASQHLARRLPTGSLVQAASCGVQNTPPGSAHLSLHARVAGLTTAAVDHALATRMLAEAWSLRASPCLFPTADTRVFTTGLLPDDEASLAFFMLGARSGLARLGMAARDLVERTTIALHAVLAGRAMTKDELGLEIAARVAGDLDAGRRAIWESPSPVVAGQTLGESMVRFALPVTSLQGDLVAAPRSGRQTFFVLPDRQPGALRPPTPDAARAELVRRYLRCCGPSTSRDLAAWAGISLQQAARNWSLVEGELAAVSVEGRQAWLLAADLPRLLDPEPVRGVRFLPAHDPYLQCRDRELLLPDPESRKQVWRKVGSPGVVLVDGEIAGAWRPDKHGDRLALRVKMVACVVDALRARVVEEAQSLAAFRGARAVDVVLDAGRADEG